MHLQPLSFTLSAFISLQVAGFVAALQIFFIYGLTNRTALAFPGAVQRQGLSSVNHGLSSTEPTKTDSGPYRPPHLRKKNGTGIRQHKAQDSQSSSDHESSMVDFTSSDSDYSDTDGSGKDSDSLRISKARLAAIACIQVSCHCQLLLTCILVYLWLYYSFVCISWE